MAKEFSRSKKSPRSGKAWEKGNVGLREEIKGWEKYGRFLREKVRVSGNLLKGIGLVYIGNKKRKVL